ncbi:MAG: hypothetical protein U0572_02140 [Phycisphaerales bacterium]
MGSEGGRGRNNTRTGLITLLATSFLAVATISAPKFIRARPIEYALRVPGSVDVTGLEAESEVLVGGLVRGRVLGTDSVQALDGTVEVVVRFELEPDPPLFPDARARIVRNLISQQAQIYFSSTGVPRRNREPLPPGTLLTVEAADAPSPSFLTASMNRSIDRVWNEVQRAQVMVPPLVDDARYRFTNVRRNAAALADTVAETWPTLRDRGEELFQRFNDLRTEFECLAEEAKSVGEELGAIKALTDDEGSWGRVRRRFDGLAASWSELRESAQPVGELLDRARAEGSRVNDAWARFAATTRAAAKEFRFDRILANLALAATEFGKLYDEVMANPLSALIKNQSARDARRDALDGLSRSMLESAEQARVAAASLRAVLDASDFAGEHGAEAIKRLGEAVDQIGAIEDALWRFRTKDPSER